MPWPCTWCGQFNTGFSQNRDPAAASATELAAELARHTLPTRMAGTEERESPVRDQVSRPDPPPPRLAEAARRPGRRPVRRLALLIALGGALAATAFALIAARSPMAAGLVTRPGHGVTRAVHVAVSRVGGIDFQGVAGQLTITGTGSSQVTLTGQVHGTASAPAVETRLDRARGVLLVSVQCAPGSPCTESLRLGVPAGTRAAVRQPSGQVVVAGLSASLSITAENVDVSASGLRSPDFAAAITSGHLSATFTAPPQRVSVQLASAQATIRTPAWVAYQVTQQVMSGYIDVAIPRAGQAPRVITARVDSGELELLPS